MPSHKHLHMRQAHHHWNEFVQGVESVASELNPFKDAPHTLQERAPETVYKTVYTTMSANFDGPIAGWTTVGVPAETTTNKEKTAADVTAASSKETTVPKPNANNAQATESLPESLPESLKPSKSVNLSGESTLAIAGSTPLSKQTPASTTADTTSSLGATDAAVTSSPTSTSSPSSSDSSPGVKAGIAIGVLGGLLVVALLIFFLFSKRRKQLEQQRAKDDEKVNGEFAGGRTASIRSTRTSATAPRLSLRPVTQFNPTFNERRSSKGAGLMLATAGAQNASREKGGSMWERPSTAHSNNSENPFNDNARAYSPTKTGPTVPQEPPSNPFDSPEHIVGMAQTTDLPATPTTTASSGVAAVAIAAAAGAAVGTSTSTSLTRKASTRKEAPEPLDLTMPMPAGPPSPTGTDFSMNSVAPGQSPGPSKSATAIADAGGPPATAVHRVQLDFKPSMGDELELQAGQLVRVLHEYDDGWALCIRLDRSRQGVVPRTCLSTRPVKPRPAGGPPGSRNGGPPVNPSAPRGPPRGPGPNPAANFPAGNPQGRPESPMRPMNGRPQSPAMRPYSPAGPGPRPQSPAQMRPYSPAGPRPQSPAQMRPYSPAGGRPMSPHTGRPASPAGRPPMSPGPRSQSPGPRQQRSQSPSGMNRRHSPPGPSPMNPNNAPHQFQGPPGPPPPQGQVDRKPVPGQAY
ncbi:hypothetical protein EV127DRAFT_495674 [Xylaria flabelliformis]|nr:hypothetical protein EV127DRAFT_495674 [Xylaria flabelliformis]